MDALFPEFSELRQHRADELVMRTGISEREAFDLIDGLGFERSALMREALIIIKRRRDV